MKTWVLGVSLVSTFISSPVVAQERFTGDLCGNKADVILKTPGADANPELKKFYGVWGNGKWINDICTALAVTEVNGNTATVQYFYGAGRPPDSTVPSSFIKTDAVMKGKYLYFRSMKGFEVTYELVDGQLMGWFGNVKLAERLKKLQ